VWSTVADDAFLPVPYNSRWAPNRADLHAEEGQKPTQSLRIPADALVPEQGRSRLVAAPGGSAMAKLAYKVQLSAFHDGSDMEPADLLYPIAFAFRWGGDPASRTFDPEVARRTALLRERLKAVQILRTEESKLEVADLTFVKRAAIVEVYIDDPLASDHESAVLTPPWSAIPWHLLGLMESAVERGIAAFSRSEAERRGVPWLDLVRDPAQTEKMAALVREFAATGYVPEALKDLVSVENAKGRWRALEKFIDANNHLLVTNGPYRLKQYARDAFVFEVVRDFTYPIGIGTFDLYTYPPRVLITAMEQAGNNVMVSADVEMEIKAQRVHRRVREPLKRDTLRDVLPINPSARYVVVAGDGKLIASGAAAWQRDGRFQISLPPGLGAGGHTLFVAVFPGGNTIRPDIGRIGLRQN
jgi:hypothetical protein